MKTLTFVCLAAALLPRMALADAPPSDCVEALEQVMTLKEFAPTYKLIGVDQRQYLDDANRPKELASMRKAADVACSTDRTIRQQQRLEAQRLHISRSPDCAFQRDKLAFMQAPDSRDPPDDTAAQRKLVADRCPGALPANVWLLDAVHNQ